MSPLQRFALALALIASGLYAGMLTLTLMGDIPAIQIMSLPAYAAYWQALDHYMHARMLIFGPFPPLLLVFALICFARQWRRPIFWALIACLILNVADGLLTTTQQVPINIQFDTMDLGHLDLVVVQHFRDATVHHFHLRGAFSISAFVLLTFASIFSIGKGRPGEQSSSATAPAG
jgi:hypothetical protein